jgi:ERCC4-type nuclease
MINHDEVDENKAMSVGNLAMFNQKNSFFGDEFGESAFHQNSSSSSSHGMIINQMEKEYYRYSAQEILLSLPGINSQNYRSLLSSEKVNNLKDLSQMKEKELIPLIGPVNAKKLYSFFHQKE